MLKGAVAAPRSTLEISPAISGEQKLNTEPPNMDLPWPRSSPFGLSQVPTDWATVSQVKQLANLLIDIFTHVSLLDLRWKGELNISLFEQTVHNPKSTKAFLESLVYWALHDVNLTWVVCRSCVTLACYTQVQPAGRQDHSDQRPHRRHQPPCGEGGHHHLRMDGQCIFIHIIDTVVAWLWECRSASRINAFYSWSLAKSFNENNHSA